MSLTFLGLPNNLFAKSYVDLSTPHGDEPDGLEASFLKTEEPSDVARIPTLDPKHTYWKYNTNLIGSTISGLAVVNHNLTPGSLIRYSGDTTAANFAIPITEAPNAVVSSSNITGGITNVDEDIDSPDGLQIVPTVTTAVWNVVLSWGALISLPKQGFSMAFFVLRMQRKFSGAGATNPTTYPVLEVELREGGSLVETLGRRIVTSTDSVGQIFIFGFDPGSLADPSGTNIEIKISCTTGLSPSGGQYAALESVALYYEPDGADYDFDSGWIVIPETGSLDAPTKSTHYLPETAWTGVVAGVVKFISDQSEHDPLLTASGAALIGLVENFPSTYVEAGVLLAGDKFELSTGIQPEGPQVNVEIEEVVGRTLGGQTYGADSFRFRMCEPTPIVVNRAEKDFLMDNVAWRRGHSGAFYVILETGTSLERQVFTSFWATLKSVSTPRQISTWHPGDEVKYNMTIAFEEKL